MSNSLRLNICIITTFNWNDYKFQREISLPLKCHPYLFSCEFYRSRKSGGYFIWWWYCVNCELHSQSLCFWLQNATIFNIWYLFYFKFVWMCCLFVFFCLGGAYWKRVCIYIFSPKKSAYSMSVPARPAGFPTGVEPVGGGGGGIILGKVTKNPMKNYHF